MINNQQIDSREDAAYELRNLKNTMPADEQKFHFRPTLISEIDESSELKKQRLMFNSRKEIAN
jgi:hypothetical protein